MNEIHRYVGYVVVGIFAIGWLFGLVLWISRREAGSWFWRWLVVAQIVAIVQALGRSRSSWFPVERRPLGCTTSTGSDRSCSSRSPISSPARTRSVARPWIPFALASFICFGLSLRALTTGLGIG